MSAAFLVNPYVFKALPDPLELAPPEDQPIITAVASGAFSGVPTVTSSAGWMREKRVGVAETAPGVSQTSTNDLDLTGSTRFAYPALPGAIGHAANPGQYVSSEYKPGSDASHQSAKWLFAIDTITSSPAVEFRTNVVVGGDTIGLILVNGKKISEKSTLWPAGSPATGAGAAFTLTFPDSRERRITIYGLNNSEGRWGGGAVEGGYDLVKPPAPTKKIAILGDSYVNGHSGVGQTETWAWDVALSLGADSIMQAGIGGTGFTQTLVDMPDSNYQGRVTHINNYAPDVLIIMGGRNDYPTGLQTAVESLLASFAGIPEVYVCTSASESGQAASRAAIASGTQAVGRPYIDVAIDSLPKIADGIHPTYAGHRTLAQAVIAGIN